tara:strand:- start:222 stop:665 length:444 start_codon:yes stop_codon:yes gene_type:complete
MNYSKLRDELANDPLGRGYSGMTDAEAAADLMSEYRTLVSPITMGNIIRWAARHDAIHSLETAVSSGDADKRRLSRAALAMIDSPQIDTLDIGDVEISGMFDALVALGVFTSAEQDDLVAFGTSTISRATEAGLGRVKPGYVGKARA